MIFEPTQIEGAYVIRLQPHVDIRGSFVRSFCQDEFARRGLETDFVQCSFSTNHRRGTLRGMHMQKAPYEEAKLVRCIRGRIYDVLLDLRPGSPSYGRWQAFELDAEQGLQVYIPKGVAHGFQTLEDHSEVFYQISCAYHPEASQTIAWNDVKYKIVWPIPQPILSDKDKVPVGLQA